MRLEILQSQETRRVYPQDIVDYATFNRRHRIRSDISELQAFERFYAARSLMSAGMDTYLDATVSDPEDQSTMTVDTCGAMDDNLTIVFCETESPNSSIFGSIDKVCRSQNARAIILAPPRVDFQILEKSVPDAFESGKIEVETLRWFDDYFDRTLQETLRLVGLLGNETRMRMLAPLFRRTGAKREYRVRINPKLVYQNLSVLLEAGLVDEMQEGTYELSELGKSILAEFITFLEKTRKTLDSFQGKRR